MSRRLNKTQTTAAAAAGPAAQSAAAAPPPEPPRDLVKEIEEAQEHVKELEERNAAAQRQAAEKHAARLAKNKALDAEIEQWAQRLAEVQKARTQLNREMDEAEEVEAEQTKAAKAAAKAAEQSSAPSADGELSTDEQRWYAAVKEEKAQVREFYTLARTRRLQEELIDTLDKQLTTAGISSGGLVPPKFVPKHVGQPEIPREQLYATPADMVTDEELRGGASAAQ